MRRYQFIDYKPNVDHTDLLFINPKLLLLFSYISLWCNENGISFQVTSIIRSEAEERALGAKSRTHSDLRAFDFSLKKEHGWDRDKIEFLVDHLNDLVETEDLESGGPNPFYNIGAVSASSGKQKVIVVHGNHNGPGIHAHVQVRK